MRENERLPSKMLLPYKIETLMVRLPIANYLIMVATLFVSIAAWISDGD